MAKETEFDYEKVERLAALGLSKTQIAASFATSRRTVSRRLDPATGDDEFIEAFERGRSALAAEIGGILLTHARSGSTDAAKFLANSRLGWTPGKKNEIEFAGENVPSICIKLTQAEPAPALH